MQLFTSISRTPACELDFSSVQFLCCEETCSSYDAIVIKEMFLTVTFATTDRISSYLTELVAETLHFLVCNDNAFIIQFKCTDSNEILGFILICLSFTTGHFYTRALRNQNIIFHFNCWLRFQ